MGYRDKADIAKGIMIHVGGINVLNAIQNQANKSKINHGHIRVIIEKRQGNEYPKTKKIN